MAYKQKGKKSRDIENDKSLEAKYIKMSPDREVYLNRAREVARYCIPQLMLPLGWNATSKTKNPNQSFNAKAINALTAKIVMALFPPNTAFFKYGLSAKAKKTTKLTTDEKLFIDSNFAITELEVQKYLDSSNFRPKAFELVKQMLSSGDCCVFIDGSGDDVSFKVYNMDTFTKKLARDGTLIEAVLCEAVAIETLSEEIIEACELREEKDENEDEEEIYTCITLKGGKYEVYQEINEIVVPGSEATYPMDRLPYIFTPMILDSGEHYGRPYAGEYLAGLKNVDGLSKALNEGAALAAKSVCLVDPNGVTSLQKVKAAMNGDSIHGREQDVRWLTMNKAQDFNFVNTRLQQVEQELAGVFLMMSSITRQAERVTAEEITKMAGDLENQLGGFYTMMANKLQYPLAKILTYLLAKKGVIPNLNAKSINMTITTGMEALGRGMDIAKIQAFLQDLIQLAQIGAQPGQPNEVVSRLKLDSLITRLAMARGISAADLVKSLQEMAAENAQKMQDQMVQQQVMAQQQAAQQGGMANGTTTQAPTGTTSSQPAVA